MAESIAEFMKHFKDEQKELIVRIDWCYEKGNSPFSSIEDCYKVQARFDMALDAKTGEMLSAEPEKFHLLEWFALKKKKLFAFKYGFKFEKGKNYRILAREYINKPTDKFIAYYVDEVLEYNVKDNRLDMGYLFDSEYDNDVLDLAVLIKSRIYGWSRTASYRFPKTTIIASVDLNTKEQANQPAYLCWIEKDTKSKLSHNFEDMGIYHIKARRNQQDQNSYMLVDVIKKVHNEYLEEIKEAYLKPVTFMYREAEFTLSRQYNRFIGELDYLGEKCDVFLHVSDDDISAENHIKKLDEIFSDLSAFDSKVKEFAAEELLNDVWEADEDGKEITKEDFMKRMGTPSIDIEKDGSMCFMYDSDGMFTDHSITISISSNGDFEEAGIEG